jgi:hypothetical protein
MWVRIVKSLRSAHATQTKSQQSWSVSILKCVNATDVETLTARALYRYQSPQGPSRRRQGPEQPSQWAVFLFTNVMLSCCSGAQSTV